MALPRTADMVICGAGIAGVATSYFATERLGGGTVVLCDPRPPLTLTSDKSTECYRNWWPNPPMVGLMNRSIELLDRLAQESEDAFRLNRRGYLYVTAESSRLEQMIATAAATSAAGGGPIRLHGGEADDPPYVPAAPEGWRGAVDGADIFTETVRDRFPYLSESVVGALHARTAGWFSAQQLGIWMLNRARDRGLVVASDAVVDIDVSGERITAVRLGDGSRIATETFVNAAGPFLTDVAGLTGTDLPVHSELHLKVAFKDTLGVVPRDAPMLIWSDSQRIDWSPEERALLADRGRVDLLSDMPAACHGRPEGGPDSAWVLALWEYTTDVRTPTWPLPRDPLYAEVVIRGMSAMIPGLEAYRDRLPETVVDGGYYTKTIENRPLVGPTEITGSHVVGALSGFGLMAGCAVGELAALHAVGGPLPAYAGAFSLERYSDPAYLEAIAGHDDVGQL